MKRLLSAQTAAALLGLVCGVVGFIGWAFLGWTF